MWALGQSLQLEEAPHQFCVAKFSKLGVAQRVARTIAGPAMLYS